MSTTDKRWGREVRYRLRGKHYVGVLTVRPGLADDIEAALDEITRLEEQNEQNGEIIDKLQRVIRGRPEPPERKQAVCPNWLDFD